MCACMCVRHRDVCIRGYVRETEAENVHFERQKIKCENVDITGCFLCFFAGIEGVQGG